jgi:hypothetical protein
LRGWPQPNPSTFGEAVNRPGGPFRRLRSGGEVFVARNWTVRVEYLYTDFSSFTNTFAGAGAFNPIMVSTHLTDQIARVGFNYHFF